ncbi:YlxR family protein [Deinococcus sp. RIT780]|uniref:YlxR family protein n=1 Tax=Deinococcus sp. RIT780 TaxID=2870472 RepID=UPI00351CDB9E
MLTASPAPTPDRHTPERTCVACRRRRPQAEFTRLARVGGVWGPQSGVRVGRGAYVCADSPDCWQQGRLRRAFGAQAPAVSAALVARSGPEHRPDPSGPPVAASESTPHAPGRVRDGSHRR